MRILFYRVLYAAARAWWFVRRPRTQGAVVAMWHDGRVLIVKSSYRRHYGLPGGFLKRGEQPAEAAAREVGEELNIRIAPSALTLAATHASVFEHRHDTTTVWEVRVETAPPVRVDRAEVVSAEWLTPAEARARLLSPAVAGYLADR